MAYIYTIHLSLCLISVYDQNLFREKKIIAPF